MGSLYSGLTKETKYEIELRNRRVLNKQNHLKHAIEKGDHEKAKEIFKGGDITADHFFMRATRSGDTALLDWILDTTEYDVNIFFISDGFIAIYERSDRCF